MSFIMPTYRDQLDVAFERGEGIWLWDQQGQRYLDALSGFGVSILGHSHPAVVKAIQEQSNKIIHTSNCYRINNQEKLAEKLVQLSAMKQVVFANSGAEANEIAIKLTRLYARKKKIFEPIIINLENAFHGHTMAATSASGIDTARQGFEPLLPQFIKVPLNNLDFLYKLVETNPNIIAIMLEAIQGDGGIRLLDRRYLEGVRSLCDEFDLLMVIDEVLTGIGRTGEWFAFQYSHIMPDIVTIAKAIANGIPLGACLVHDKACNLFPPGSQGSTFAGGPLACATALAVLQTLEEKNILVNVRERGAQLLRGLKIKLGSQKNVLDVRGNGLMVGIELDRPCLPITRIAFHHKLLIGVVAESVIRLFPPYIISEKEIDLLIDLLTTTINEYVVESRLLESI